MYPGHWEGEPSRWTIVVNESWWRAKGIYYSAGLLLLLLAVANLIIYIRNVRMRVRRTHEEGNIVSKICLFAERAENMDKASLSPLGEEYSPAEEQHPTAEFCDIMERLLPVVSSSRKEELTMRRLGEVAGVDIVRLYEVVTANIHKSPRDIIRRRRLRKAAEDLQVKLDPERFEQEMIFYLEKLDINEEKVRLRQHCKYFMDTIDGEPAPGRKLGFIIQEMGREINTTRSKANHAEIQKLVVRMKDELE